MINGHWRAVRLERAALAKLHTAAAARRVCAMAPRHPRRQRDAARPPRRAPHADIEAVYTYEGTGSIQSLIVGGTITALSAFT